MALFLVLLEMPPEKTVERKAERKNTVRNGRRGVSRVICAAVEMRGTFPCQIAPRALEEVSWHI